MEKDESRETATSSNPYFRPDFKSSGISQHQRAKFLELQQRRLRMKTKTKTKTKTQSKRKPKDNCKNLIEDVDTQSYVDKHIDESLKNSSSTSDVDIHHPVLNKKKLHWGLDTKARWERKANM